MLVYIREAHPDSVLFVPGANGKGEILERIGQTATLDDRARHAAVCTQMLQLTMPAVVDKPDNKVNAAYAGWPERLVIVGTDGRVAYPGFPGPFGFRPKDVEDWLAKHLPPAAPDKKDVPSSKP